MATITLPADWEAPKFTFGQEVAVRNRDLEGPITGIRLDTIDEPDVPPYDVWMYRVGARWFEADSLISGADLVVQRIMSQPTPKRQYED